ncbi:MAG: SurA N-terminal domain-containing protein, partial [Hyphomicrobiaceae bacterium]|nr:SurA N-terminal domain-containing protein [Hyphomicrobiaceae bacterium]
MLKSIHKTATALFTKALVGLLILSFAALGIAEIFTSTDNPTIASMGDQRISTHDFKRRYQEQLDLIAAQYGQHLTPQQARAIGVENSVLLAMLNELASNAYAQDLKLHITDNAVVENIRRDTLFAGVDGQFSPQLLIQARNRLGISELEFITMRRANIIRDHIINSLLEATTVPPTLYNAYQIFNHEQRKARYFVVDTKHFNVPPSMPDEKVLRDTYSANKSLFMTDELRDVEILMLTLSDVKRKLKISKNQLRKRYYRDIKNYTIPETRRVLQIPFRSVRAARKASNDIINGKHFDIVAKENEANEEDIDLGKISKDKLIDPIIAEAAFTLKKGEISKAIEGRFTVALLKVTDISPSKVIQFKDVQKQIRDNMINNMAPYEMRKLLDSIDDNRLAGKSFKEIAKLLGITFHEVKSINRSGYDTNDKLVISSPDLNKIMLSAFESAINIENDFIKLSDGGYAWTKTSSIIKEMQKPFEQVQDEVKKIWHEKQERK